MSEMCSTCLHKSYCMASLKKDSYCGNYTDDKKWRFNMVNLEKERMTTYIKDLPEDDIKYLLTLVDTELMLNEIMRRDRVKSQALATIYGAVKLDQ